MSRRWPSARRSATGAARGHWLGNLGNAYADLGQVEKAIEYYQQALAISQETGDRRGEGNHLRQPGESPTPPGAGGKGHRILPAGAGHQPGDRRPARRGVTTLGNLGNAYADLGQVEKAIGNAYAGLGQVEKAIEYLRQALTIFEEVKSPNADIIRQNLAIIEQGL